MPVRRSGTDPPYRQRFMFPEQFNRNRTVRQVMDDLNRAHATGYTTVLKMLQIMTEKGLVQREEAGRLHVYEPTLTEEATQRQLLTDLLDRAFDGSAQQLVLQALAAKPAAKAELAEIRRLLDELEGGRS